MSSSTLEEVEVYCAGLRQTTRDTCIQRRGDIDWSLCLAKNGEEHRLSPPGTSLVLRVWRALFRKVGQPGEVSLALRTCVW